MGQWVISQSVLPDLSIQDGYKNNVNENSDKFRFSSDADNVRLTNICIIIFLTIGIYSRGMFKIDENN